MLYLFCCCLMEMLYLFRTSQSTVKVKLADAVSSLSYPLTWMPKSSHLTCFPLCRLVTTASARGVLC